MRRLRVAVAAAIVVGAGIAVIACGDDDTLPASPPKDGGAGDVEITEAASLDDVVVPDEDGGTFAVVEVADTPCTPRAQSDTTVFTGTINDPVYAFTPIGARRIAQRSTGFYLVDADGSNPSAAAVAESAWATALDDATIASVISNGAGPELSIFDANGTKTLGGVRAFEGAALGLTISGGGGTGLAVFATQFGVYARGVAPSGYYADAFVLAPFGAFQNFHASVARKADGTFGVAMSGETPTTGEEGRLSFVRATTTNRLAAGFNLEISAARREVVQVVARKSGWAMLLAYGKGLAPHLVLLDDQGRLDGPVLRLAGGGRAYGLAVSGDELGVFALHDLGGDAGADAADAGPDGGGVVGTLQYAAFRPFDVKGAPLGGWVCLGDGVQSGGVAGAILGEDNGYAVMYPRANGDTALARFDRRGN